MENKTIDLMYRGKKFSVVESKTDKGLRYDAMYDEMVVRKGLPDMQRAVNAARNFIDKYAGLPAKERKSNG